MCAHARRVAVVVGVVGDGVRPRDAGTGSGGADGEHMTTFLGGRADALLLVAAVLVVAVLSMHLKGKAAALLVVVVVVAV